VSVVSPFLLQYGDDLELTYNESLRRKLGDDRHQFSFKRRNYICDGSLIRLGVFAHHTTEYTCRLVRC